MLERTEMNSVGNAREEEILSGISGNTTGYLSPLHTSHYILHRYLLFRPLFGSRKRNFCDRWNKWILCPATHTQVDLVPIPRPAKLSTFLLLLFFFFPPACTRIPHHFSSQFIIVPDCFFFFLALSFLCLYASCPCISVWYERVPFIYLFSLSLSVSTSLFLFLLFFLFYCNTYLRFGQLFLAAAHGDG